MNTSININRQLLAIITLFLAFQSNLLAQSISCYSPSSGCTSVIPGSIYTYQFSGSMLGNLWQITDGTIQSQDDVIRTVTIQWNQASSGQVKVIDDGFFVLATLNVTIAQPPAVPNAPIYQEPGDQCAPITLIKNNEPTVGSVSWYWQNSTTNNSASYSVNSTNNYWLRAYNSSTGLWSSASPVLNVPTVTNQPSTPSLTISPTPGCDQTELAYTATDGQTHIDWYWQKSSNDFTLSYGNTVDLIITQAGTYYLRAYNGCWSDPSVSYVATVNGYPAAPSTTFGTPTGDACSGPRNVSRNSNPTDGSTWWWQTSPTGGSASIGSGQTITVSSTATYWMRAKKNGCWSQNSSSQSVYVEVGSTPSVPTGFTLSKNESCNGITDITINGGTTWPDPNWYWVRDGDSPGTHRGQQPIIEISNAGDAGVYRVAALNGNCWSAGSSTSVNAQLLSPPSTPSTSFTVVDGCSGIGTVTRNSSPTAPIEWYWQSTQHGKTTTLGSGTSPIGTITGTSTFYLSAYNSTTQCWSTLSTSGATVTVNNINDPPISTGYQYRCEAGSMDLEAANPLGTVTWYYSLTGNDPVIDGQDGIIIDPSEIKINVTLTSGQTRTFYLEESDEVCVSVRTRVDAISLTSSILSTSADIVCGSGTSNMTAVGAASIFRWYLQQSGGAVWQTGASVVSDNLNEGESKTYWVSNVAGAGGFECESVRTQVVVITQNIDPPTVNDEYRCEAGEVILLATNLWGSVDWYHTSSEGSPIVTDPAQGLTLLGNDLAVDLDPSETRTFYAEQSDASCTSSRTQVDAISIFPLIDSTSISIILCETQTFDMTVFGNGTTYRWYTDPVTTTVWKTGINAETDFITPGDSLTYWVAAVISVANEIECESQRIPVVVKHESEGVVADCSEFMALKAVYDNLGGAGWFDTTGWPTAGNWPTHASATEMGNWFGVTVTDGDVTKVDLSYNNLSGNIPSSISKLSEMNVLQLRNNTISGGIPNEITNLVKLTTINLMNNSLTGPLPNSIGDITNLVVLVLNNNSLSGTIPASLYNLVNLSNLNLYKNQFSGNVSESISNLTNLTSLTLRRNQFSGPIPLGITQLTNLVYLNLMQNNFSGAIPYSIGNLNKLTTLFLSDNSLTGELPVSIGNLTEVVNLDLYKNQLSGALPSSIGGMGKLKNFRIYNNNFSGPLPSTIGDLVSMWIFQGQNNNFSDKIPPEIGNCKNIRHLDLTNNNLSGELPSELFTLYNLKRTYLGANNLTGAIKDFSAQLSKLEKLLLYNNDFTGVLPNSFQNKNLLNEINISGNNFTSIPDFSNHSAAASITLTVDNNQLDFGSIESQFTGVNIHPLSSFVYSNQTAGEFTTQYSANGSDLHLVVSSGGTYTHYQWQKDNNGTWETIAGAPDANQYVIQNASQADLGTYRVEMTNDWVTSVTIYSAPIEVLELTNRPDETNIVTIEAYNPPAAVLTTTDVNYVRAFTARVEGLDRLDLILDNDSVQVSTQYMDGLGRPTQTIIKKGSPLERDIMQPIEYDAFGRVVKEYLPYTIDAGGTTGDFRPDMLLEQYDFYNHATNNSLKVAMTHYPFSEKEYEASPLNRILKQAAPGESWRLGSGHEVQFDQRPSNSIDDGLIPVFEIAQDNLIRTGTYNENELMVNSTTDEHGNRVMQYTNKQGQTILKKVEEDPGNFPETYYAYDEFGKLRFVLPPEMSAKIAAGFTSTDPAGQTLLDTWAFQYRYDGRQRMIAKKVPGADWVYMVYDQWDRLVLTQDGNQRLNDQWSFTKYDVLNRPIITGIYKDTTNIDSLRNDIMTINDRFEMDSITSVGYTLYKTWPLNVNEANLLTVNYYDHYNFPHATNSAFNFVKVYEDSTTLVKGQVTGTMTRNIGNQQWLKGVVYYDDRYRMVQTITKNQSGGSDRLSNKYDFTGKVLETMLSHQYDTLSPVTTFRQFEYDHGDRLMSVKHSISKVPTWENIVNVTVTDDYIMKTGGNNVAWDGGINSIERIYLNQDGYLEVIATTDAESRMFGFATPNNSPGYEYINYAFYTKGNGHLHYYNNGINMGKIGTFTAGDTLRVEKRQGGIMYIKNGVILKSQPFAEEPELVADFSFKNGGGRYDNVIINFGAIITSNTYNELGELIEKDLHLTGDTSALQSVDYRYNIRGWLTSINNEQLTINSLNNDANDFFGMELYYDQGFDSVQHNGNIAGVKWKTAFEDNTKAFGYVYDPLNRLQFADYVAGTTGAWNQEDRRYQTWIKGYDDNGNILGIERLGSLDPAAQSFGVIDQLDYSYNGNQLFKVGDSGNDQGFKDGLNLDDDYIYDANGNMIVDQNKDISSIDYNHLNLPSRIQMGNGDSIVYVYDASGIKLTQKVYTGGLLDKKTDYIGEFIYENDTLRFIQHEEGRVVPNESEGSYEYQYHIKDHLGNVRLTFTSADNVDTYLATMEPDFATIEEAIFENMDTRQQDNNFDHTDEPPATGNVYQYSSYLTGGAESTVGPTMILKVGKGDSVDMTAYGKFKDLGTYSTATVSGFIAELAGSLDQVSSVVETAGEATSIINGAFTAIGSYGGSSDQEPRAYLNYILFDDDFGYIASGFDKIDAAAGYVADPNEVGFDQLGFNIPIDDNGYIYIWLSNETEVSEVWFDDLFVEHTKSRIIQTDDYYPFGLTMNSYQRTGSRTNDFLFQGQERQDELDLNWIQFKWRNHDPAIGRFFNVDPLADDYVHNSPYAFSENKVTNHIELEGLESYPAQAAFNKFIGNLESTYNKVSSKVKKAFNTTKDATTKIIADKTNDAVLIGSSIGSAIINAGADVISIVKNADLKTILNAEDFTDIPSSMKSDLNLQPVKFDDELNLVPQGELTNEITQDQAVEIIGATVRTVMDIVIPAPKVTNISVVNQAIKEVISKPIVDVSKKIEDEVKTKSN